MQLFERFAPKAVGVWSQAVGAVVELGGFDLDRD